jgi:hypothetical protein
MICKVRMANIDGSSEWVEDIAVPDDEDSESYIKQLVEYFNKEESKIYGATARLRKCVGIEHITDSKNHNWEKVQFGLEDRKGVYDLLECSQCLLQYKRYGLRGRPIGECHPDRVCVICNREFKSVEALERHQLRFHR